MRHWKTKIAVAFVALVTTAFALPSTASAFCGFYVGGAGAELFNDATQVVLMRDGTKTVLSMQNRYDGPTEDFAMVVPVPEVLMEENVKTLDDDVFGKIDTLTSPRLVEYWEQDPCQPHGRQEFDAAAGAGNDDAQNNGNNGEVNVEAQFKVGEYEVVVLSSNESTALEAWLEDNDYNIPDGAGPYFQPYIDGGDYFFVAKVDTDEVKFDANGNAVLSPLRFHYTADDFKLPIRLGMINSRGQQDMIVYTLADQQRYEVANYPNVTIPTNIEVVDDVRNDFGSFYKSLFARTLKENPGAAVTEYAWNAGSCDPCPGPVTLTASDIETLGGDVLETQDYWGFVVTRIHLRYDRDEVGEDLVFEKAEPIVGGRERHDEDGVLETGATPAQINNFQARYIIRHRWDDAVTCDDPQFGIWGGDPDSEDPWGGPAVSSNPSPNTSGDAVFSDGESQPVEDLVREDVPEIGVIANPENNTKPELSGGCSAANVENTIPVGMLLMLGGVVLVIRRRRN